MKPRRKRLLLAIGPALLLMAIFLANLAAERSAAHALASERDDLRSSGFAMTLDQILGSPPKPEEDAAAPLREVFALFVEPSRDDHGVFYAKGRPYSAAAVDSFVNANTLCLAKLDAAVRRPRCTLALDRVVELALHPEDGLPFVAAFELCDLLAFRARRQAERGDADGGLATLSLGFRLHRLISGHRPDLRAHMGRLYRDGQICRGVLGVLEAGDPTESGCRELDQEIAGLYTGGEVARGVAYHRLCVQRIFQLVREHREQDWLPVIRAEWGGCCFPHPFPERHPTLYSAYAACCSWVIDEDEIQFLQISTRVEELARSIGHRTSERITRLCEEIDARRGALTNMSAAFWPELAVKNILEEEARRSIARVALALRVHRLRHGAYPDELAALAPAILASVPLDPFNGLPLVYKRDGDGFAVHSVGPNGRDDAGVNADRSWERDKPDDVAAHIAR